MIILMYTRVTTRHPTQLFFNYLQRIRALALLAGNALRYKSQNSICTSLCSHHNKVRTRVHIRVSVKAADMTGDGVRHDEFGFTCGQVLSFFPFSQWL